jgi:hypothetical protein
MAEHIDRYKSFSEKLNSFGFHVVGLIIWDMEIIKKMVKEYLQNQRDGLKFAMRLVK